MPVMQESIALSIRTILLATDFSATSQRAEVYAKALARRFGSTVEITHVFNPSVVTSYEEAMVGVTRSIRESHCEERLRLCQASFARSGIATKIVLSEGHSPAKELLKIAQEPTIDLIIAGTESRTGMDRWLLGSTAEHLIRHAPCPLMTVGPHVELPADGPLTFNQIICATDYSPESAKAATFALSFAEDTGARLTCCYIEDLHDDGTPPRTLASKQFKQALQRLVPAGHDEWCVPEYFFEHSKSDESLLALAAQIRANLIVLGARKSSFWLDHIDRGLMRSLLAKAPCPILTVPPAP